jgi:FkbM family methyltransferase
MVLQRVLNLVKRKHRAKKLGLEYQRAAEFEIPNSLVINGDRKTVSLPQDYGVKVAFVEILLDDCYGLDDLSKPILNILDIGANVGLFSIAARNRFPQAVIHAYEPNPQLEKYLQIQAKSAGFDYFMEAVGLEDGKVTLDFYEDSVQTRSRVTEVGKIPQVAFRKTIERFGGSVDLAKIDCEGAEWQLFQDQDNWQSVQNLSLEYHLWPDHKHEEIQQVIQNLGFQIKKQIPIENYGLILASRQ